LQSSAKKGVNLGLKGLRPFMEVTPNKGLHDLCGRKFLGKRHTQTFQASLGKFVQKYFAPPKIFVLLLNCTPIWLHSSFAVNENTMAREIISVNKVVTVSHRIGQRSSWQSSSPVLGVTQDNLRGAVK